MKLCIAALVATIAGAEDMVISGQITEQFSGQPVAGATVRFLEASAEQPAERKTLTGPDGRYSMTLPEGQYGFVAHAEGYDAERRMGVTRSSQPLDVRLQGLSSVEGRILHRRTKLPMANVQVHAQRIGFLFGRRQPWPSRAAVITDVEGTFRVDRLPPGDYQLELQPEIQPELEEDGRTTGYARSLWPAGSMIHLRSGAPASVGDLQVERSYLGVVKFKLTGACDKGVSYNVDVSEADQARLAHRASVSMKCEDTTRLALSPGEYNIIAAKRDVSGIRELESTSGNPLGLAVLSHGAFDQDLQLDLRRPILVNGSIAVEGMQIQPEWIRKLSVVLFPIGDRTARRISPVREFNHPSTAGNGTFQLPLHAPPSGVVQLHVYGLPAGHYVKQLLYNGAPVDLFFDFNSYAPAQSLDILLSGEAASLSGTVRDDQDRPAGGAKVLLTPWPITLGALYPFDVVETTADKDGRFTFATLRPREYRIFSVAADRRTILEQPNRLTSALGAVSTIAIQERQSLVKDVKLSEP